MLKVKRITIDDTDNNLIIVLERSDKHFTYHVFRENGNDTIGTMPNIGRSVDMGQALYQLIYPERPNAVTTDSVACTTFIESLMDDDNGHDEMCETDR